MKRKPNKLVSIVTVLIFAVAFLVPATASAAIPVPAVTTLTGDNDNGDLVLKGRLTAEGETTEYGFYYDTDSDVDETDVQVVAGSGDLDLNQTFTETVTGLADDTYYFKAYVMYDDDDDPDNDDALVLAANNRAVVIRTALDDNGDLDVVTYTAKGIKDDEATLRGYVEVDEEDENDYDIYEYGFFWGDNRRDVEDVADILDDGDNDWECDYDSGDDIDYDDGDEQYDFSLDLSGLDEDEDYYYRAYIEYEDDHGDAYYSLGSVKHFVADRGARTRGDQPEVSTGAATDIDNNSATLNGTLEDYGDDNEITSYGFYWGATSYPATREEVGDEGDNLDEGDDFDFDLTGLKSGSTYYFRAYARSSDGTGYGSIRSFTTRGASSEPIVSMFTIGSSYYIANGKLQTMDAAPYVKNNRSYVPVRYAAYAMGLTDANIQVAGSLITLTKGSTTVQLYLDSPILYINGSPKIMDVSPEVLAGRTYLPVAWLANAFGHYALWDGTFRTVTIR